MGAMSLSSHQLDAFQTTASLASFSKAARALGLTQSALSQRILNLEAELGVTLLLREPTGVRPTDAGQRLLEYCQRRGGLEAEFLRAIQSEGKEAIGGPLRIATFSTLGRSVLLPMIAELVASHPKLQVDLRVAEVRDLADELLRGRVDYLLTSLPISRQGIENEKLGMEENVWVRSTKKRARRGVFLDHDADDPTCAEFFRLQGQKSPVLERNFLDEIYAILDGVRMGLGEAIVPKHLVKDLSGIEIVPGKKPLLVPVYLSFYKQDYYTKIQELVLDLLRREVSRALSL